MSLTMLTAALRSLLFGACLMLVIVPVNAYAQSSGAPETIRGGEGTDTMGAGGANAAADNLTIQGQNPYCNQNFANAFDAAREKALTVQLSRDSQYFQYQISGAFAANCVGKTIGYAKTLLDALGGIFTAATAASGNPAAAAITLITNQILKAVFEQIVSGLENQICNITNQLTTAIDSVYQNAICIPSADLALGGLFNFNLNLNLPNLQCDGFAINPLQLAEIDPATGQPYTQGESNYTAGILNGGTGSAALGGYNGSVGFGIPPMRGVGAIGDATMISGDPDPGTETLVDNSGGNISGTLCGNGSFWDFMDHLAGSECNTGYTCVNRYGYIGRWQMGCSALITSGFVSSCSGNSYAGYNWTSKAAQYGVTNYQQFLQSSAAQKAAAATYEANQWRGISSAAKSMIGQTITYMTYKRVNGQCVATGTASTLLTASGLMAAAHLKGPAGASRFIASIISGNMGAGLYDANCISPGIYASRHGGFDISSVTGAACNH